MSAFGATSIRGRGDQYSAPFGHGASHNAIPGTLRGMPHRRGNAAGAHALRLALRDGDFTADDYEQLLALDRLQPRESKGLTRQQLASIPTQKGARHAHEPDCVICVEPVKKRQVCLSLPCTHEFHAQCIKKWLAQNPTCPICKGAYSV
ncbi:hypothetical protein JKP88DRAFT_225316 [Tribonema minus]|uniref:RING-type domain-containing protein n=1 Tax=Tribonema minus TaxID=303371 RepID=A0A836CAK1_9STRA|nr:hypothetical protein JKP88DRAFT_225316 [Tribonema minus]